MTELEFLLENKSWAERILSLPVDQLPGALTHAKAQAVLDDVEDKLIDFLGVKLGKDGEFVQCYIDPEKS